MDKKQMSELEIRSKFILPFIKQAGWAEKQIRENVSYTAGRILVFGKAIKRGNRKEPDYILEYKPNMPLAVIEAKDNNHSLGDGMQQAIDYSSDLDLPFAFTSNGETGTGLDYFLKIT